MPSRPNGSHSFHSRTDLPNNSRDRYFAMRRRVELGGGSPRRNACLLSGPDWSAFEPAFARDDHSAVAFAALEVPRLYREYPISVGIVSANAATRQPPFAQITAAHQRANLPRSPSASRTLASISTLRIETDSTL